MNELYWAIQRSNSKKSWTTFFLPCVGRACFWHTCWKSAPWPETIVGNMQTSGGAPFHAEMHLMTWHAHCRTFRPVFEELWNSLCSLPSSKHLQTWEPDVKSETLYTCISRLYKDIRPTSNDRWNEYRRTVLGSLISEQHSLLTSRSRRFFVQYLTAWDACWQVNTFMKKYLIIVLIMDSYLFSLSRKF